MYISLADVNEQLYFNFCMQTWKVLLQLVRLPQLL